MIKGIDTYVLPRFGQIDTSFQGVTIAAGLDKVSSALRRPRIKITFKDFNILQNPHDCALTWHMPLRSHCCIWMPNRNDVRFKIANFSGTRERVETIVITPSHVCDTLSHVLPCEWDHSSLNMFGITFSRIFYGSLHICKQLCRFSRSSQ